MFNRRLKIIKYLRKTDVNAINKIIDSPAVKCLGFTLAETLITLGIIGVVAAMTIPNLIAEHQKRVTVTKLQRAISVLNQAYRLAYDDIGELSETDAGVINTQDYFNKYWAPYIKKGLLCNSFTQCGYKSNQPFLQNNGYILGVSLVDASRVTFYTPDGYLYIIFMTSGGKVSHTVYVDINGSTGPNKMGHDLFDLVRVEENGGGIQPLGYTYSLDAVNGSCKRGVTGYTCAEKIRRAGWQIDKSYPW